MFASLDFVYVPAADVDAAAAHYTDVLGARLEWKVRGMGTTVACVRLDDEGQLVRPEAAAHFNGRIDP